MKLELHWFLEQINAQPVDNHWQAFARAAFREELDWQQRALSAVVLSMTDGKADARIAAWAERNGDIIQRWATMAADFRSTASHEFAKFSVALRELLILVQSCGSVAKLDKRPAKVAAETVEKAAVKATEPAAKDKPAKAEKAAKSGKAAAPAAKSKPAKTKAKK